MRSTNNHTFLTDTLSPDEKALHQCYHVIATLRAERAAALAEVARLTAERDAALAAAEQRGLERAKQVCDNLVFEFEQEPGSQWAIAGGLETSAFGAAQACVAAIRALMEKP